MTELFLPYSPRPDDPQGHMVVEKNLEEVVKTLNTILAQTAPLPYLIDIDVIHTPIAHSHFGSVATQAGAYGAYRISDNNTTGASISWDVLLSAGTWTFEVIINTDGTSQTFDVDTDDGTHWGSITTSGSTANSFFSLTGVDIANSGIKRLTITKTSTLGGLQLRHIQLKRTA